MDNIIMVGGFHEMVELCEDCGLNIVGIIDNKMSGTYEGVKIIGTDDDRHEIFKKYGDVPVVLTPDKPAIREKLYHLYKDAGFSFKTVISPTARISRTATIGVGTVIQDKVNVSSHTKIGDFVKLNTMSNVMHDCNVGGFTTIAPNVDVIVSYLVNPAYNMNVFAEVTQRHFAAEGLDTQNDIIFSFGLRCSLDRKYYDF